MVALKEIDGQRKLLVSEPYIMEKCPGLKSAYLKKARCVSDTSWRHTKDQGMFWYEYQTIPNRKPHFVQDCIGKEEDLVRIARFGNPNDVQNNAKQKLIQALEDNKNMKDLYYYQFECEELLEVKENDKRSIKEIAESYFEAYSWLVLINLYFNNGWIKLGLPTKRQMMQLIVELLAEKQIKGLRITNTDSLQRKINLFNEHKGDKRKFVIHKNYDNKNRQIVSDEMVGLFMSLFKDNGIKLNFEEVWYKYTRFVAGELEIINLETGEVYDNTKYRNVSKSTIKLYLHKYENKLGVFASRSGDWTKFKLSNIPTYQFEMPKYANSLLSIDDFQPPFKTKGNKRTWFYAGVDLMSECCVAYVYGRHSDKDLDFLRKFYRTMLINFQKWGIGLPKEIEMESSLNSSLKGTLLVPGVITDKATIYQNSPNSKKIERFIGKWRNEDAKNHPNWQARPFAKSEFLTKGSDPKEMEYEEIIQFYIELLNNHNNALHSNQELYPGKSRMEVWLENQNPDCQPIDWTKILPYLGYETYSKASAGIVKFGGDSYLFGYKNGISTGEELIDILHNINDQRIKIYYIKDEDGNTIASGVYTDGDKYICSLYPMPKIQKALCEQTEEDNAKKELMARYQQSVIGTIKRSKESISDIQVGKPSEINIQEIEESEVEVMPTLVEETYTIEKSKKSLYDRF